MRAKLNPPDKSQLARRVQAYLDAGNGQCQLRDPTIAGEVEDTLLLYDGQRYRLLAWVVMPNHVHVVIQVLEGHPLPAVLHCWKSYTARFANEHLQRKGRFWQREYFDRVIRDDEHLANAIQYIHNNPVKARLVAEARAYRFSSARM